MAASRGREQLVRAAVEYFAERGVGDHSLRAIAEELGTSHRMLIYHFGSREGLLVAVREAVEAGQRDALAALAADADADPRAVARQFWSTVSAAARRYGPLFFELSAHAMQGRPHASGLSETAVEPWIELLTGICERAGVPPERARVQARLGLGVARGLLHDALVTGDAAGADEAMDLFVDLVLPPKGCA
ncbi:TetR/AcrR family transcriptional regulator [Micromonospora sonchi]|uniref:TetR/AcrR family transcriptional regulator n=1 Tax=Micromonospora sonchi TaxID=1763543 RepID=UPI00166872BF|nr:TetR/AcrR family transcriptional regulator [Micromonospora sonchi]